MDIVWILAEQIGLFVIYIVVGILLVKTRVLTRDTLETISRFVMKLAMPVMIFTNTVDGVDRSSLLGFPLAAGPHGAALCLHLRDGQS